MQSFAAKRVTQNKIKMIYVSLWSEYIQIYWMEKNRVLKLCCSETIKMENTHYLPHFLNHTAFFMNTIHCKIKSITAIFSLIY